MDYSAPNQFVDQIAILLEGIVTGPENVAVDLDGQVKLAKNVKYCPDVNMAHALNLQNVNVRKDGVEFYAKLLFVLKDAIKKKDTAENLENADVKLDGGARIVNNVTHIQDASMETVPALGNVTVNLDGEECCVIKN